MHHITSILAWSAALATVNAHGVILNAQGPAGPSSFGFRGKSFNTNFVDMHPYLLNALQSTLPSQETAPQSTLANKTRP